MENYQAWISHKRLDESATSAQTILKLNASLKERGHTVNKQIGSGEHAIHTVFHSLPSGERYKTMVKGDVTTSRPARPSEAVHFMSAEEIMALAKKRAAAKKKPSAPATPAKPQPKAAAPAKAAKPKEKEKERSAPDPARPQILRKTHAAKKDDEKE